MWRFMFHFYSALGTFTDAVLASYLRWLCSMACYKLINTIIEKYPDIGECMLGKLLEIFKSVAT